MKKIVILVKPMFLTHRDYIVSEFEKLGCTLINEKTLRLNQDQCNIIWGDLKIEAIERNYRYFDKDYFVAYCDYVKSGDCIAIIMECPTDIEDSLVTNTKKTIRRHFSAKGFKDILHTSDNNEDAEREILCLFTDN